MARVLLFGPLSDLAGWRERTFAPAPATLSQLKAMIARADRALGAAIDAPGVRAAVDRELVAGDIGLADGAEVAFLPPMSGG
ncbi:MAG: MoaD/ThiS family protein [Caulobacteraceae bacterium]